MRTLKFNVKGQAIEKDPNCDFSGIVAGSKGYLTALFSFDSDWKAMNKVAVFSERDTKKNVLITNNQCVMPEEVLTRRSFKIRVVGKNSKGAIVKTNEVVVKQEV